MLKNGKEYALECAQVLVQRQRALDDRPPVTFLPPRPCTLYARALPLPPTPHHHLDRE
jgi:hypothetical protein